MATIQKRKNKNNTFSYRVMTRQSDGFPPAYKTFPSKKLKIGRSEKKQMIDNQ